MTRDVLDRLRQQDPGGDLDPAPPDELLERLRAEPRPAPMSPHSPLARRRVRIAVATAAAVALLAVISVGRDGSASPDLTARAYAQTSPTGEILHVVLRNRIDFSSPKRSDQAGSHESWVYGEEAHAIVKSGPSADGRTITSDQLLRADGTLVDRVTGETGVRVTSPEDGAYQRELIAQSRRDFVADFRARYEQGELDDTGTTTFMGRPARRYVVESPARGEMLDAEIPTGRPDDDGRSVFEGPDADNHGLRVEYFLDASSGAPLGSVSESAIFEPRIDDNGDWIPGEPLGTMRVSQIVERIERLPATKANLAKVRQR